MAYSRFLMPVVALCAAAAFIVVSQPVQAASCAVVTAKARGVNQATAAERSNKKLNRHINRWARKNKLSVVRVGYPATGCTKGAALAVCMSSATVCP